MALRRVWSCGEYSPEEGKDNWVISFMKKDLNKRGRKDFTVYSRFWGHS